MKTTSLTKGIMLIVAILAIASAVALSLPAAAQGPPPPETYDLTRTLADGAQRTTIAFSGLGMMTGNLEAQSFFPPGKVADYTGFQYLRDNDPDGMGHNTSFLTRVANNVIYILNDAQFSQLKTLAIAQIDQINLYGYKRYPLMKAFRRLMDRDIPEGSVGLDVNAVKQASRELYLLDGQISFDRALLYANVLNSLNPTQKAYLAAMKGKGWNSWPNITNDQIKEKMRGLPPGTGVAVMTYAGDLFSWYAGSVDADVYFCPERHGTYYGSFYIKDAPAIGHEGYSIDEQLTATAGSALCDSSKGYVTPEQAAVMSSLVETQRNNLYASPTANIVKCRTDIATLLRSLLVSTASSAAINAQVLAISGVYGELDGENNYNYATVFSQVQATLTQDQKDDLMDLRQSIMSGTYSDGTPFDFTVCTTPFLYSSPITDPGVLEPYIADTDYLFAIPPRNVHITPSGGILGTAPTTIQSVYHDGNGCASIRKAYMAINDSLGQTNCALLLFDQQANRIYLRNDANTSWGTGYAPGTNIALENGQCYVYVGDTSVSGSGDDLTINWRIALKSAFAIKALNGYMYALDASGLTDGWELMGSYYNIKPQVVSIAPNSGALPIDTPTTLTSLYSDSNGCADLRKCYVLLCEGFSQANATFLYYDKAANKVYLKNDANTSWGTGYVPGANIILSNSQCEVYVKDISVSGSGNDLTVVWAFKLKTSQTGKNLLSWMYAADSAGAFDGWKKMGTHFTPTAPTCVSVTPSAGNVQTGTPLVFSTEFADDNGYSDISICYLQMSVTSSAANGVFLLYDAKQGKVFLRNDANTAWSVGQTPGTNVTLENSQCKVYVKDTKVTASGSDNLLIDWSIELKPSQIGKKLCERMFVRDSEGLYSPWKVMGYVRAQ